MRKNQIVFDRVNHFHFLVYIKTDVVYKYSIETLNRISPDKIWYEEHKWETVDLSELSENLFDADRSKDAVRSEELSTVSFDLSAYAVSRWIGTGTDNVKMNNDKKINSNGKSKIPVPHKHFSHLFNAYSRYLQTRNGRTGNLFERPFKRKIIDNEEYLKTVVLYIHNNPVHHGFCSHPLEYPWTSYLTSISEKPTKLKRDEVIKLFNDTENFKQQHNQKIDVSEIEKWLEIAPTDLYDFESSNPDAEKSDADSACPDWSGSEDAVRSGETDVVCFDLSACAASRWIGTGSDNVKILDDNVKMKEDDELN